MTCSLHDNIATLKEHSIDQTAEFFLPSSKKVETFSLSSQKEGEKYIESKRRFQFFMFIAFRCLHMAFLRQ
jgi:hypothetical protein